jgi:hypothetical protein
MDIAGSGRPVRDDHDRDDRGPRRGLIGRYLLGRGEAYTPGWIMSIVGAVVLLALYRYFANRRVS